jgi:hypothetical protein
MKKIVNTKKIIVAVLLLLISVLVKSQAPSTQLKTRQLIVVDNINNPILKTHNLNRKVEVFTVIPPSDSSIQASTTAWVKRQLYAESEERFKRFAIPFGTATGKLIQDSANFKWDGGTLVASGTTTNSLLLNFGRFEMQGRFAGALFNVGSGLAGGGIYDPSKSYIFQNRGNTYLTIGSTSNTIHTSTFNTDLVVNGVVRITGGNPGSSKVLTSDAIGNASWQTPSAGGSSGWALTGNSGTDSATNFIGTTNNVALNFRVNNTNAGLISSFTTALGFNSYKNNTTGIGNSAFGSYSLFTNTTGVNNTAIGNNALQANTTGFENTAAGIFSLQNNTTGFGNAAIGYQALNNNTTGTYNTALGFQAGMLSNSINNSVAIGAFSKVGISNAVSIGDTAAGVFVGIGTAYPTTKLDLKGGFKLVDGTQGAGKILTSDGTGKASWQANTVAQKIDSTRAKDLIAASSLALYAGTNIILRDSTVSGVPGLGIYSNIPAGTLSNSINSVRAKRNQPLTVVAIGNSITAQSSFNGGIFNIVSELHWANTFAGGSLFFKRMVATTRGDVYGTYAFSGATLLSILTDIDVQLFTPLYNANIIPDVVYCNALVENDLGQNLTTASMINSINSLIQTLQSRWPGVIIHLCTPHLSNSYTGAILARYQSIRDYILGLDNNINIFVTRIDLYEDPINLGMPIGSNFTGSISGTTLTVTSIGSVPLRQGSTISTPTNSTQYGTISFFGTGTGGTGTYTLTASNTVPSTSLMCNIFTDGVHPNARAAMLIGRAQAVTINRYASGKQMWQTVSNNMIMSGTAATTGTNVSGTWTNGFSVSGTPAISKLLTANQPYLTIKDTTAAVISSATVAETGNNGFGSLSISGLTEFSPYVFLKIISGGANIRNIAVTPRIQDGSGNNFRAFLVANTNSTDQDFIDGDSLLFRMPSQIAASGSVTALQNYIKIIPKLSGGQTTVQVIAQGFAIVKKELMGLATLVSGTVTVSTPNILSGNRVFATVVAPGGTQGFLSVPTIVNGTSFTITSSSVTETSTVNWKIEQ